MVNIDRIMYLLDWNRSEAEQHLGMSFAKEVMCLDAFFRPAAPGCGKRVWENCALIICERSDAELKPYIFDMLLWLEDLNWPGAELIQDRLIQFQDVDLLATLLNELIPALKRLEKNSWLFFLSDLLRSEELKNALNQDVVRILFESQDFFRELQKEETHPTSLLRN